jgi:hypothetical protein
MMKTPGFCLLVLTLVSLTTGCKSLFPSDGARAQTAWNSFDESQAAYDRIIPHQTTLEDLRHMGFDPHTTPNIKVLTYLDLIERFLPNNSITKADLHPDVRACIEAKDCCQAFEVNLDYNQNKRYGNLFLDVLGFKKRNHTTGWNFTALIILNDDVVAYKLRSGQPGIDRYDQKTKPLGPLQELGVMKFIHIP